MVLNVVLNSYCTKGWLKSPLLMILFQAFKIVDPEDEKKMVEEEVNLLITIHKQS